MKINIRKWFDKENIEENSTENAEENRKAGRQEEPTEGAGKPEGRRRRRQEPRFLAEEDAGFRGRAGGFLKRVKMDGRLRLHKTIVIKAALFAVLFGAGAFLFFHTGSKYITVEKVERNDASGTQYLEFGSNFLKYSADGVSCIDSHSNVLWSTTFTMQTPVVDICETAAVVAEQQGKQIYVFDAQGLKGQFQTRMPIEKVRVARQGVVAAVLQDEEVTWVNFYEASGALIAENRTSIGDFGYPMDIDLSPDGMRLAVSYLGLQGGRLRTRLAFYGFDAAGQAQMNNLIGEKSYSGELVPQVIFHDNNTAVAVSTEGFTIFSGKQSVKEKKTVPFETEVRSVFYDESRIGIVTASAQAEHKYQMQIYNLNGKKIMEKYFDLEYNSISLKKDQIILFNEKEFAVYKLNGRKRFQGKYRKPIENIMDVRGFGKYMILTQDSADLIRLG